MKKVLEARNLLVKEISEFLPDGWKVETYPDTYLDSETGFLWLSLRLCITDLRTVSQNPELIIRYPMSKNQPGFDESYVIILNNNNFPQEIKVNYGESPITEKVVEILEDNFRVAACYSEIHKVGLDEALSYSEKNYSSKEVCSDTTGDTCSCDCGCRCDNESSDKES